jgi:hypothetical protein
VPVWPRARCDDAGEGRQEAEPRQRTRLAPEASGGKSRAEGWRDGHGPCRLTPHQRPSVGRVPWMSPAGQAANRMAQAGIPSDGLSPQSGRESQAEAQALDSGLTHHARMALVTVRSPGRVTSASRPPMSHHLLTKHHQPAATAHSPTVAPMQGVGAAIFARERCWRRGEIHPRWRWAAMGVAVQLVQGTAWTPKRATWKVPSAGRRI